MSAAASPTGPGHPARAWARALLLGLCLALALLIAPTAAAPAQNPAPSPAATASIEPGELLQETPEATLRLPTGHPTRLPEKPRRSSPARPTAPGTEPGPGRAGHPVHQSHRALRTVVLRC